MQTADMELSLSLLALEGDQLDALDACPTSPRTWPSAIAYLLEVLCVILAYP